MMDFSTTKNEAQINLHATLPFGIGTTKFGFVKAVHALSTIILMVAAFANSTPARPITKRPESLPFDKI